MLIQPYGEIDFAEVLQLSEAYGEGVPLAAGGGVRVWTNDGADVPLPSPDNEAGNFGHNKDNSYRSKYPKLVEKSITFFRRFGEYARLFAIFPADAPKFFVTYVGRRTKAAF